MIKPWMLILIILFLPHVVYFLTPDDAAESLETLNSALALIVWLVSVFLIVNSEAREDINYSLRSKDNE